MPITEDLQDYLKLLSPRSKYVLVVPPFNVVPLSVAVARRIVVDEGRNVLYICAGRPHIFPQKLFQRWEIPLKNIYFMDTILYMKGPAPTEKLPPITAGKKEIKLPRVYRLFRVDQEVSSLSLSDVDVIILDNITEFLHYNSLDDTLSFIDTLHKPVAEMMKGFYIIMLNTPGYQKVLRPLKESGFVEASVPPELFSL